jgi:hypothetical protein
MAEHPQLNATQSPWMSCDVGLGPVIVKGPSILECNGSTVPFPHSSSLVLFGPTSTHSVSITDSALRVELSNIILEQNDPISVIRSTVSFALIGSNHIHSFSGPGIACAEGANLSFSAAADSSLTVVSPTTGIGASPQSQCSELEILNGSYTASGSTGIGGSFNSTVEKLRIRGGAITAIGDLGAALGSGHSNKSGSSTIGSLTISNSVINATGKSGAAIGAGASNGSKSVVTRLEITNAAITATGYRGSGIGAGASDESGVSAIESISIAGGRVTAVGHYGAAIGAGTGTAKTSVGKLAIANTTLNVTGMAGGAAIGPGFSHGIEPTRVDEIVFTGLVFVNGHSEVYRRPIEATSIVVGNGSIVATVREGPVFGSSVTSVGPFQMLVFYGEPPQQYSEPFSGLEAKWLLVEQIILPVRSVWDFCITEKKIPFERCFAMNVSELSGFIVSLPGRGSYDVSASAGEYIGFLQPFPGEEHFDVGWAPYVTPAAKFFFPRDVNETGTEPPASETKEKASEAMPADASAATVGQTADAKSVGHQAVDENPSVNLNGRPDEAAKVAEL